MIAAVLLVGLTKWQVIVAAAGWLLAAIWLFHAVEAALGMRKVTDILCGEWNRDARTIVSAVTGASTPKVTIVVPARNEAGTIEPALRSLRQLDYPNYEIIAVNDRSEDATGEIMERVARDAAGAPIKVVHVRELPSGWLGKTHAMWMGAQQGSGEWVLFTDADVVFRPDALRRAVAYAEQERADHLVLFPTMLTYTMGERMMISLFQALVGFGHRPWKVADPDARDYIGVGAFNMIRRSVYEKLGTYERLRLSILDDMQLGALVKKQRFRQRVAFGKGLASIYWAAGVGGIVRNLEKNLFAYMRFNLLLTLGAAFMMLFVNLGPLVGLLGAHGWDKLGFAVAAVCIATIYIEMAPRTDISPWYFATYPISSSLFIYAALVSAYITLKQGGVIWRGTLYKIDDLKRAP